MFSPSAEDRIKEVSFNYFLSLSIGRVMAVEGAWPPTSKCILHVHWLHSSDGADTPWKSVKFTDWEIEEELTGALPGRQLCNHHGRIAVDEFVHNKNELITVDMVKKKSWLQLRLESAILLDHVCCQVN